MHSVSETLRILSADIIQDWVRINNFLCYLIALSIGSISINIIYLASSLNVNLNLRSVLVQGYNLSALFLRDLPLFLNVIFFIDRE
jgi:hypothetical protein